MREKGEENYPPTLVIVAALNEEEGIGPTLAEIKNCLVRPLCLIVDEQCADSACGEGDRQHRLCGLGTRWLKCTRTL